MCPPFCCRAWDSDVFYKTTEPLLGLNIRGFLWHQVSAPAQALLHFLQRAVCCSQSHFLQRAVCCSWLLLCLVQGEGDVIQQRRVQYKKALTNHIADLRASFHLRTGGETDPLFPVGIVRVSTQSVQCPSSSNHRGVCWRLEQPHPEHAATICRLSCSWVRAPSTTTATRRTCAGRRSRWRTSCRTPSPCRRWTCPTSTPSTTTREFRRFTSTSVSACVPVCTHISCRSLQAALSAQGRARPAAVLRRV